jgi:hypothetical protein
MQAGTGDERAEVVKRAQRARHRAIALQDRVGCASTAYRQLMAACLVTRTSILDSGHVSTKRERAVRQLAGLVGRDTAIEDAKAIVASRYGITRGEAFELLRHMSQRSNRKLRDVAHDVIGA